MAIKSGPYDLSPEVWREYSINGGNYRIDDPIKLWLGDTSHRVLDKEGIVHCIPFGPGIDTILRWKPRDLEDPVQF